MSNTEFTIILTLVLGIYTVLFISSNLKKSIENAMSIKLKQIEDDNSFSEKINMIKYEIDFENELQLSHNISKSTEYFINDAIRRSGSVSKGKVIEHFAPYLSNEILNPNEIVFMGSPIDLISFTNIDTPNNLSIQFFEIKSGNSTLNKKQKLIRNAINERRVYFKSVMLK